MAQIPDEESEERVLIYEAKGLSSEEARAVAQRLMRDKDAVLDTMAREELGINPQDLGGSAWAAAGSSFLLFMVGAIVPVAPFFFLTGNIAIATSAALSAFALFLTGAAITLFTGRGIVFSGTRQLLIGLAAAGVTFGVGHLLRVTVGG